MCIFIVTVHESRFSFFDELGRVSVNWQCGMFRRPLISTACGIDILGCNFIAVMESEVFRNMHQKLRVAAGNFRSTQFKHYHLIPSLHNLYAGPIQDLQLQLLTARVGLQGWEWAAELLIHYTGLNMWVLLLSGDIIVYWLERFKFYFKTPVFTGSSSRKAFLYGESTACIAFRKTLLN